VLARRHAFFNQRALHRIGKVPAGGDEERPTAHGGIENSQAQDLF
jgi:hypothetical protein